MKKCLVMRGLPGSGKTTYLRKCFPGGGVVIASADDYYLVKGVYRFDPARIGMAHNECLRKFLDAVSHRESVIAVDNTNLAVWEFSPYYRLAEVSGYETRIVTLYCGLQTALRRNVHGVPADRLYAMMQMLLSERVPPHWRHEVHTVEWDGT